MLSQSNWLCCRDENELIRKYFWEGFQYQSIVRFLQEYHGVSMSVRTLYRRLRDLGLARRQRSPPLLTLWNTIHMELRGPG